MIDEAWRPQLRTDVTCEQTAGRLTLLDPVFGRSVPAGALTAALVARLDGRRLGRQIVAEVVEATGETAAEVHSALRSLLLLGLLEGTHEQAISQAQAVLPAEGRVLPRARFGCVASGQCCHVYRPGPLTDGDVARLDAHSEALLQAFPELPPGPWVEEHPGDTGALGRYLARSEGRCVFLRPDRRCGVHAVAGREAKPEACRLFPFDAVRTLDGMRVFDVSQCSAFAVTSGQGASHADYAPEVLRLAPARPRLFHPLVLLDLGAPCDYLPILALEARLLELADEPSHTRVPRCAALSRVLADALRACPLAAGQPGATVEATLQRDRVGHRPVPPEVDPAQWAVAIDAVAHALEDAADAGDEPEAPLIESFRETVSVLRSLAADRAGLAASALPDLVRRARALPCDDDLLGPVLRASLRNRVFGGRFLVRGHLRAGVLSLALHELLTVTAARVRAAADGADRVREQDVSAGHWITSLSLARPRLAAALLTVQDQAWIVAANPWTGLT